MHTQPRETKHPDTSVMKMKRCRQRFPTIGQVVRNSLQNFYAVVTTTR